MQQLQLFSTDKQRTNQPDNLVRRSFSHSKVCDEKERLALEEKYAPLLEERVEFNRRLVSFQGNKSELLHGWIKYKEGFSAQLVEKFLRKFDISPGETVLDPFSGSSTTLLVAKSLGIDGVGIELLAMCHLAWEAKSKFMDYDLDELAQIRESIDKSEPDEAARTFPHITITEGAFPPETENDLMYYSRWFESQPYSDSAKILLKLLLSSILEEISYTRKDGQYLRWDHRSSKVRKRNEIRATQGKKLIKKVDKGPLPTVKEALLSGLVTVIADIKKLQQLTFRKSRQELIEGNTLWELPTMEADQFSAVITSPPYCNRYDYTRTYALELAYLGEGQDIRDLRQSQLSCTVENRPKIDALKEHYLSLGQGQRFAQILETVQSNPAFVEINEALQTRWKRKDVNNRGVLRMVEQYFTELTFVFAELYRTCKKGAYVVFVNDNVRYAGEVIPVDLLSTNLAEKIGFEPIKVYVLPQRKGNSSQQMGKFGREPLRKSITIWRKA